MSNWFSRWLLKRLTARNRAKPRRKPLPWEIKPTLAPEPLERRELFATGVGFGSDHQHD